MYAELTLEQLENLVANEQSFEKIIIKEQVAKNQKYLSYNDEGSLKRIIFKGVHMRLAYWNDTEYQGSKPKYTMIFCKVKDGATEIENRWSTALTSFGAMIMKKSRSSVNFTKLTTDEGLKEDNKITFKVQLDTEKDDRCKAIIVKINTSLDEYLQAVQDNNVMNLDKTIISHPKGGIVIYKNNISNLVPTNSTFIGNISVYIGTYPNQDGKVMISRLFYRTLDQIIFLSVPARKVEDDVDFLSNLGLQAPVTTNNDIDILRTKVEEKTT